jgi:hypothetical protein
MGGSLVGKSARVGSRERKKRGREGILFERERESMSETEQNLGLVRHQDRVASGQHNAMLLDDFMFL